MKKIISTFAIVVGLFLLNTTARAQEQSVDLPSAGLTPESSFYFLDRFVENLLQFFTFDYEAKAKLQIELAGERIAEIKVMIEKEGPETEGIEEAKSLLVANVAYAAEIVNEAKVSGKDVTVFAKSLDDEFDAREELLDQTFLEAREKLLAQRKEMKEKLLKEAQEAGDDAAVALLTQQLADLQNQADFLIEQKDGIKKDLQTEKSKIEQEMSSEDQDMDEVEKADNDEFEDLDELEDEFEDFEDEFKDLDNDELDDIDEGDDTDEFDDEFEDLDELDHLDDPNDDLDESEEDEEDEDDEDEDEDR